MTALYVPEEAFFGEAAEVIRMFSGETHIRRLTQPQVQPAGRTCIVCPGNGARAAVYDDGQLTAVALDETEFLPLPRTPGRARTRQRRHQAKRALYRVLAEAEQRTFPWGALTGIRPVKLFRELAGQHGPQAAERELSGAYGVSGSRIALSRLIYDAQQDLLKPAPRGLCVYVGIPFCPTRCRYCSFIAQDVASARRVRNRYLDALIREIEAFAGEGAKASCIYIGGGTPTTLSPAELERLLGTVRAAFPGARELTLEAGRPDTISPEILALAGQAGVSRISINPQTCHDETLARIGRAHTASDYAAAMELPRPVGMLVNNDMIVGLPGEGAEEVVSTLESILSYAPENITVHALAVKKAADLAVHRDWQMMPAAEAERAADTVRRRLLAAGYVPYYLYRQKYMSGNLENVGYARPGTACLYNVLHMEELASVAAFGAGAVSKRVYEADRRIERCGNVRNVEQYVDRIDEMIGRKKELFGAEGR